VRQLDIGTRMERWGLGWVQALKTAFLILQNITSSRWRR